MNREPRPVDSVTESEQNFNRLSADKIRTARHCNPETSLHVCRRWLIIASTLEHAHIPWLSLPPSPVISEQIQEEILNMRKLSPSCWDCLIAASCWPHIAARRSTGQAVHRQRYLQITREYTKPYKNGMAHDKTESAFVEGHDESQVPRVITSRSVPCPESRAPLFLTPYDCSRNGKKTTRSSRRFPLADRTGA